MGLGTLDSVPKELFVRNFPGNYPSEKPGQTLWLCFGCCLLFQLFNPSVIMNEYFPSYINAVGIIPLYLNLIYIIPCIIFSRKKMISKHPAGYCFTHMFGVIILQLQLWVLISGFVMLLCCTRKNSNDIDPVKGAVAAVIALMMLLAGVVMIILMFLRMRRRIIQRHFRENGSGFWGDWAGKQTFLSIVSISATLITGMTAASILIGRAGGGIIWDQAYAPILIIVAFLLMSILFFLLGYAHTVSIMRIYYFGKFGLPKPLNL